MSCSRKHRADLTQMVSQDQSRIDFATSYSPASLTKLSPRRGVLLFLRKKIFSLHFNERHSASFLRPQAVSCANPQNFIFFLNQLHLHFTEPSEASSLSGCERGLCWGRAGVHIWSCLREPGPRPSQHKHSDSSNVSLWLLWQLVFPCRPCMCGYGCRQGITRGC